MHADRDAYQAFHRERHQMIASLLEAHVPERKTRLLDIGGGGDVGALSTLLRERIASEMFAVELEGDVERARERGVTAHDCDVDESPLPFADEFFDVILFASVIEHLYSPHRVLREIERVLRPGGLLLLEAPNAVSLGRRIDALTGQNPFRWFNEYNAFKRHARMEYCSVFYTAEEVAVLLAESFEIVEIRYGMHLPPANIVKRAIRKLCATLWPRTSDCFAVLARRK